MFRADAFDLRRPDNRMDPGPITATEVDGRRARLVRGRETAEVQVELPDGSAVVLYGPSAVFTDDHLLRMAAAVSLTKRARVGGG